MFIAQALKNALRRVTLLFDQGFIGAQYLIDDTNISIKVWTMWRFSHTDTSAIFLKPTNVVKKVFVKLGTEFKNSNNKKPAALKWLLAL